MMRDTIRLYKDMMREDAMEFNCSLVRSPTQQKLKIADCVTAYNSGDKDKFARIDEREEKRRT